MRDVELKGVYPILATPFDENYEVDVESLERLIQFQLDAGVDGIAIFGNASEMYTLTEEERDLISQIVIKEVNGKVPIVFGTGATGLAQAIHYSEKAEEIGASALMVTPPYMVKPDAKRIYEYFAEIAKVVNIPIMMQDAPIASGVTIPVEIMVTLAQNCPNIKYVKVEAPPTTIKISEVLQKAEGKLKVFGGLNGMYLFEEIRRGAVGTMPACEFPDVCVKIFSLFDEGKQDEAKKLFYKHLPLIRIGTLAKYAMSVHKQILKDGGIISTANVRNPNVPIEESIKAEIDLITKELDLLALNGMKKTV
ncbi:dihydrodipicolinate synthase family protein [Alkalihalobacillus oceani]|uniref:dihydrodipicolinate synthase family protein n=1 Tax=Halalkalibacter oceani TaxID=1653776 RepID=UPI0020422544|nr:dihydrodipicolinate synthase family protein [Halalkalibacter oceani]MCM3760334.1 dihydrodipicolinate synthase family protein [Halalkalibacter oceani]